jgi:hemolysin III
MYKGERLNSITHLIGAGLAIAGLPLLLTAKNVPSDVWKIVSLSIYGSFLIFLFVISTLYHCTRGRIKYIFQKLDHVAIYLLIAGTYTPFALVTLRNTWGWWIFGFSWGLAIFGIIQELWLGKRTRLLSMIIYVIMGWMILFAVNPLYKALQLGGFSLLLIGGLLYSFGIIFFTLDERMKHSHGIWHLFVLGGSVLQYFCVLFYVAN